MTSKDSGPIHEWSRRPGDGALKLTLSSTGAAYQFVKTDGNVFDSGSIACNSTATANSHVYTDEHTDQYGHRDENPDSDQYPDHHEYPNIDDTPTSTPLLRRPRGRRPSVSRATRASTTDSSG